MPEAPTGSKQMAKSKLNLSCVSVPRRRVLGSPFSAGSVEAFRY